MNPSTPILPHRFREDSFRRYERFISQVVHEYPNPVTFTPSNSETFSCRMRDAMKSLATNHWDCSFLPEFKNVYPDLVVSQQGGDVVIGPRNRVRDQKLNEPQVKAPSGLFIPDANLILLQSVCVLHHYKILTLPSIVTVIYLDLEHVINDLLANYDIAITHSIPMSGPASLTIL